MGSIKNKKIGLIGLGKMGKGITERLLERNWQIVVYDKDERARQVFISKFFKFRNKEKETGKKGATEALLINDLVEKLSPPRLIWVMVPHKVVDEVLFNEKGLVNFLEKGDIVIDGGNSFFKDSIERAKKLGEKEIEFVDVGVSGGPKGAREGACLMIGGKKEIFTELKPLFRDLATKDGFQFFEGAGAGHFVKMVHNGIEYGMMQAIAEGFNLMKKSNYELDLEKVAEIYNHGSVIESRLIGWLKTALKERGQDLKEVSGAVAHTGEGEWTVKTAKEFKVPVEIIKKSLKFRIESQKNPSYTGKILSALREQFGGHKVTK
ncbi:decarboxylating 6-phosphogluconate dehydrogenase [Patescibacteria group bacterium]|nr:decarboxylating 6-phosphogluconate dehydrogenase [Patescibacteria group bacterium]MBU4481180.1 decarboxylating 6-phosphogluconate dehydrogenase [Patescibacteria group bacterium]